MPVVPLVAGAQGDGWATPPPVPPPPMPVEAAVLGVELAVVLGVGLAVVLGVGLGVVLGVGLGVGEGSTTGTGGTTAMTTGSIIILGSSARVTIAKVTSSGSATGMVPNGYDPSMYSLLAKSKMSQASLPLK